MKKLIAIVFVICVSLLSFGQTINGVVIDKKTKEKVCFATIYFDKTFVGTTSDIDGIFSLKIPQNNKMPLVVSSIGYYSVTLSDFSLEDTITIHLTPKEYEIMEISVKDKSLVRKRKKYLRLFKSQFLGNTKNGVKCDILNEKDISFNYKSAKDTLKAFASKPLEIINYALGYKILYYLDKFEYCNQDQTFQYLGNIIFKEDLAKLDTNSLACFRNRKDAFLGSRMHFFRSLWENSLEANGFSIRNKYGEELITSKFVFRVNPDLLSSDAGEKKFITYSKPLTIYYYTDLSVLSIGRKRVFFDEGGYFDVGLFWEGYMAKKRIGDKLPYEYVLQ